MSSLSNKFPNILLAVAVLTFGGAAILHLAAAHNFGRAPEISSVRLVDENDAARTLDSWRGKVVVLDFIYTSCGDICPIKTAQLAAVQAALDPALRRGVQFVSVSIDPLHDDPAALKAYAARTGANLSDWSFLTGPMSNVAEFSAAFDAVAADGGAIPSHITTIRLLDRAGHVIRLYGGEPVDEPGLTRDITALSRSATAKQ
jgi:protein SCO1/2